MIPKELPEHIMSFLLVRSALCHVAQILGGIFYA